MRTLNGMQKANKGKRRSVNRAKAKAVWRITMPNKKSTCGGQMGEHTENHDRTRSGLFELMKKLIIRNMEFVHGIAECAIGLPMSSLMFFLEKST